MTSSLRIQIIAGTATLVCLLVIGGAFILLREIGPGPASLLPAERTLLLVANMPPSTQQLFDDILPDLKNAPLREEGTAVAALIRVGKKAEWVTFDTNGTPSVQTPLLQKGEKPLSSDNAYSRLSTTYTPAIPWLFARFPEIKLQIEGIAAPSSPMTIAIGTGSLRLAWPSRMTTAFTGPAIEDTADVIARINAANFSSFVAYAASALTEAARIPADALLRSWIGRIMGKEISVRYDLGSTFDGPAAMVLSTASGAHDIAIRTLPSRSAQNILTNMEKGAMDNTIDAERVERTFDEKFTFETMKAGADVAPTKEEREGWTIHTIAPDTFMTAQHNREFILATSKTLLIKLMEAPMGNAEQGVAAGMVKEKQMTELLRRWHIPLNLPWKLVPGTGDSILWTINRRGSIAVLSIWK